MIKPDDGVNILDLLNRRLVAVVRGKDINQIYKSRTESPVCERGKLEKSSGCIAFAYWDLNRGVLQQ